jgi:SAM-dependent methyltransferase
VTPREAPSITQLLGVAARRTGLTLPAFRMLERYKAFRASDGPSVGSDGLPLPPPLLRIQVVGHSDPDRFIEYGQVGAELLRATLARNGVPDMDRLGALLDFGCGCGRVCRHWASLDGVDVHGSDYNGKLVEWCQENLPFMEARRNELAPPLSYEDESFDFVYALSVFTHLSEELQHAWMSELRRVIRPGGFLFFTTKGDGHVDELEKLGREGLSDYRQGRLVVTDAKVEGTNLCAAYHPYDWVASELLRGFELLEYSPRGAVMTGGQDFYLARRTESA